MLLAALVTVAAAAEVDGVYVRGPWALELRDDTWHTTDGRSGQARVEDGVVELDSGLRATAAVVDGHLWLGVLVGTDDGWRYELRDPDGWLLGAHVGEIDWDVARGRFRYDHQTVPIRTLAASSDRPYPVARLDRVPDEDRAPALFQAGVGTMTATHFSFGAGVDEPLSTVDAAAVLADRDRYAPGSYRRHGDVLLAPWSVDLGPVGDRPAEVDPTGEWAGGGLTLTIGGASAVLPIGTLQRCGPPQGDVLPRRLPWAGGVGVVQYGWDCCAGHLDFDGALVYYPIAADALVVHHTPASHVGPGRTERVVLRRVSR